MLRRSGNNLFEQEKVVQISGVILATKQNIKSSTFIFLGFCLNFKSTFTIKKFMNDFWNELFSKQRILGVRMTIAQRKTSGNLTRTCS